MPNTNRRNLLAMFGLVGDDPPARDSKEQRKWLDTSPRERIRQRYFPNIELTTHEGRRVLFYDDLIKDKLVVINFMYADCEGVCPTIMLNLARVQKELGQRVGRDIFIYSLTLRPEKDTPKVLNDYAKMHGVKPGWLLLTGKPDDIETIRRRLGFVDPDPKLDRDRSNHIGNLRYGNEPLTRWGTCPGMADADFIVKSILWLDWPEEERSKKGGQK